MAQSFVLAQPLGTALASGGGATGDNFPVFVPNVNRIGGGFEIAVAGKLTQPGTAASVSFGAWGGLAYPNSQIAGSVPAATFTASTEYDFDATLRFITNASDSCEFSIRVILNGISPFVFTGGSGMNWLSHVDDAGTPYLNQWCGSYISGTGISVTPYYSVFRSVGRTGNMGA